jgi:signal transduction histidine kinase
VRAVLETFDPAEIGELSLPQGMYEARAVTVDIPDELTVWADEARLRQVLINLLSNALKYSAPSTPVEIKAQALIPRQASVASRWRRTISSTPPSLAQLSIRDHGLGIPARDIPKLFNRFVRLERDIAGPVRGTGVGLYLCRILVEAMGGRIWVESAGVPGEGSTFTFTLPLAASENLAHAPVLTGDSPVTVTEVMTPEENPSAS